MEDVTRASDIARVASESPSAQLVVFAYEGGLIVP